MFELTDEQKDFLNSTGRVVLCACPGSGKTYIAAQKFLSYHDTWDLRHQGIALLSFTNVAKEEIISQVKCQKEGIFEVSYPHFIGTIDSFINSFILLRFGYLLMSGKRPTILRKELFKIPFRWEAECHKNGCTENFQDFRIGEDGKLYKKDKPIRCTGKKGFKAPCIEYKKILLKAGIVFQAETAGLSLYLLRKFPSIAKALAKRFPVIIIDEAQDTSKDQIKLFDVIYSQGIDSMFLIGDPDQSIYEWRNANPECFLEKIYDSEWQTKYLSHNFRSSQYICNAVQLFSNYTKDKTPNIASGEDKYHPQKPIVILYDKQNRNEGDAINTFINISLANGIICNESNVAVVTRARINKETGIAGLWKSAECEFFAEACYKFNFGSKREALNLCEKALYGITIDNINNIPSYMEIDVDKKYNYCLWKKLALELLISMPDHQLEISEWVKQFGEVLKQALVLHGINIRDNLILKDLIKIKSRDQNNPNFKNIPLFNFFETKRLSKYTLSSVHGVKGESYQSLLLLVPNQKGNTLTPSFLNKGELNTELMRIAYVAMTRPRKLLAVAMPGTKSQKYLQRFPVDKWEYIFI